MLSPLQRIHRQWFVLIGIAAVVLAVASVVSLRVVERVSTGPAFQVSADYLRGNGIARQQLGVVTGFGVAVTGGVTEQGAGGSAHIAFDVLGSWRSGHATMDVIKHDGHWWVTGAVLSVDGRTFDLPTQAIP